MERSACATDRGLHRARNEDAVLCLPDAHVYMVADGVGGHRSGETASRMAREILEQRVRFFPPADRRGEAERMDYFRELLQEIGGAIAGQAKVSKENAGMATTLVLLYLDGAHAYVVNVGDSRAYLFRDGILRQVTEDHTLVNELLKKGSITPAEAEVHPNKNMITRALGGDGPLRPDFYRFDTYPGDRFLLCTDGLYNELPDEAVARILGEAGTVAEATDRMIREANAAGGSDNITVVCVETAAGEGDNA